jgi:hypothetical protein
MSKRSPHHKSKDRLLGTTYVYCMSNWPKVWVSKFGITDHTKRRVQNVSETTFGTAYHIIRRLIWLMGIGANSLYTAFIPCSMRHFAKDQGVQNGT